MKLLVITNLFPPHLMGGYEIACYDTAKLLESSEFNVTVLTSDHVGSINHNIEPSESLNVIRTLRLNTSEVPRYSFRRSTEDVYLWNRDITERILKENGFDLVYVWNTIGLTPSFYQSLDSTYAGKVVHHFMDISSIAYQRTLKRRFLCSLGLRNPRRYHNIRPYLKDSIAISRFIKRSLSLDRHTLVLYPFLPLDHIKPKRKYTTKRTYQAIYTGQLAEHKGIFQLCAWLDRFNCASEIQVQLTIACIANSTVEANLVKAYGHLCKILSHHDRLDLLQSLSSYDVGFFPSLWQEPFGISQIEMMAAGLPVMSTCRGGSSEPLVNENLIKYNPKNYNEFALNLSLLLESYSTYGEHVGSRARTHALATYDKENYLNKLKEHLMVHVLLPRQSSRFKPDRNDPYYELNHAITSYLDKSSELFKNKLVLDFGCGECPFRSFFIAQRAVVTTVDVQQNSKNSVDIIIKPGETLPISDNTFDVICAFDVLEHVSDPQRVLLELNRVLKNGGALILTTPFLYREHEMPHDYYRYTSSGLRHVLMSSQFERIELQPLGSLAQTATILIRESGSKYLFPGTRTIFALLSMLLLRNSDSSPVPTNSPFSYLTTARKSSNTDTSLNASIV